jgi:hypothetical protein
MSVVSPPVLGIGKTVELVRDIAAGRSSSQIKIVKQKDVAVKSRRYDELLKQADYLEAQANRLAKMAREMRLLILTTE